MNVYMFIITYIIHKTCCSGKVLAISEQVDLIRTNFIVTKLSICIYICICSEFIKI